MIGIAATASAASIHCFHSEKDIIGALSLASTSTILIASALFFSEEEGLAVHRRFVAAGVSPLNADDDATYAPSIVESLKTAPILLKTFPPLAAILLGGDKQTGSISKQKIGGLISVTLHRHKIPTVGASQTVTEDLNVDVWQPPRNVTDRKGIVLCLVHGRSITWPWFFGGTTTALPFASPRASASGLQHFLLASHGWVVVVVQLRPRQNMEEGWRTPLADAEKALAWVLSSRALFLREDFSDEEKASAILVLSASSEAAETATLLGLKYCGMKNAGSVWDLKQGRKQVDALVLSYPQKMRAVAESVAKYRAAYPDEPRPASVELSLLPPTLILAAEKDSVVGTEDTVAFVQAVAFEQDSYAKQDLPRTSTHVRHWDRHSVLLVKLPKSRHTFDHASGSGARAAFSGTIDWLDLLRRNGTWNASDQK